MSTSLARLVGPAVLMAGLVASGCASPPEAEKKAAEQAVSAARAAGADKYAASDFAAMTSALQAAEAQMGAKKYSEAKTSYVKVKELADKAVRAAQSGKAAMKAAVEQQLADAEKRWQELVGKLKALARKLTAGRKQAWEADAKAVAEALQAAKAAAADDPAGAKEKLAMVTAILDKWGAEVSALAAPATVAKKRLK